MKDLEFYRTSNGQVLHTELRCPGLKSSSVVAFRTDDAGNRVPTDPTAPPYGLTYLGDLPVAEAASHSLRLCRGCALELVLDRAVHEGPATTLVLFAAKPLSGHAGTHQDCFHRQTPGSAYLHVSTTPSEVTDSGMARMHRMAARMGVPVATSTCGPTAVARVPQVAVDLLSRNLQSFSPVDQSLDPTPGQAAAFWTALNERQDTPDVAEATALLGLITRITT